jgi:F-type H+-transporting ATPase subunit gamma
MPSLKDLRIRINSVKSTQKITSAMKMVAAAKLRRAQEKAEAARPFAQRMERMMASLASGMAGQEGAPPLLAGTGRDEMHLVVVMTSYRGLCGGFNSSIVREARKVIRALESNNKKVKVFCIGRKGRDQLKRDMGDKIVGQIDEIGRPTLRYEEAVAVAEKIIGMFEAGEFDVCTVVFNRFKSAMTQIVTSQQIIPLPAPREEDMPDLGGAVYEYEPDEQEILADLLPRNIAVQLFRALLENAASEEGARMTAMDSATRNAGDMINRLTINYNRTRQAAITKELIEIISGAEAL